MKYQVADRDKEAQCQGDKALQIYSLAAGKVYLIYSVYNIYLLNALQAPTEATLRPIISMINACNKKMSFLAVGKLTHPYKKLPNVTSSRENCRNLKSCKEKNPLVDR